MSKVSIIIPTYNRAHFLPETLDSVLGQTYRNLEVLVVDNASTDDTPALMDGYMSRDARLKYLRKPENKGLNHSYNMGWENATGDYMAFFDSDDVMMPTRIEKQVRLMETRPDVGLVFTRFLYVDTNGRPLRKTPFLPEDRHLERLVQSCFLMQNSVTARRSSWESIVNFDPTLNQVQDWWGLLQMQLNGIKFAPIQEPLYRCRIHPNNTTRNTKPEEEDLREIIRRVFSDSRTPANIQSLKQAAMAENCFWSAYGYYHSQNWDEAIRNFTEAWQLSPEWQANRAQLVEELRELALTVWTSQPVAFMQGVLDHLPQELQWLDQHRTELLSAMHVGVAFRHVNQGDFDVFQHHMQEAYAIDSRVVSQPETFFNRLCSDAQASPLESPTHFVDVVMAHLPAETASLRAMHNRALSAVSLESAFADYMYGQRASVPKHVLTAMRHQPSLMKNRGAMSIFVKSLPSAVMGG